MNHKIVFIGGKQIGVNCLRTLIKREIKPELVVGNLDDSGVDSWHESLIRVAAENNLAFIKQCQIRNNNLIFKIQKINPEIIFCIGGTQIITPEILTIPELGCLNIHPAMLPKYRGRFSTVHAIFNGETTAGVTVHWIDVGIDSGPIISQKSITITKDDTGKTLYDKYTRKGSVMFKEFLDKWLAGEKITATPQNEDEATYFPKGLPNNGEIDWNWNGEKIRNFIRAMTFEPFPPPAFKLGEKEMVIVEKSKLLRGKK